jgi:biopolymer transport protein TolR
VSASVLGDEAEDPLLADINVTPLVDVMLVLLIIFMITAPMLTMSLAVELPEVAAATPASRSTIVVTVGEEGTVSVDGQIVSLEQAVEKIKERRESDPGAVYLRGDRGAPYGFVLSVLDAFLRAGITEVELVVQPLPTSADADSPAPRKEKPRK